MTKNLALIIIPIVCALISAWGIRQGRHVRHLECELQRISKLARRALTDNLAFWRLEQMMAQEIAEVKPLVYISATSVKRFYRDRLRAGGDKSPSEKATPKVIEEELATL